MADIQIKEYKMHIIPQDSDVVSMELPLCYRDCVLMGDRTDLYYAALALLELQSIYGLAPRIVGKGEFAWHVSEILQR